jgi:hypothetical protein
MSELSFYDLTYDGPVVQAILDTAQKLRTEGYIFKGVGTTSTVPGTPTERVWYLCGPGTYANFGTSVTVPTGSLMVAAYGGSAWVTTVIEVTSGGGTFATGEEVGDVSLFDALSDLEGKTSEQKNTMVPDGNAVCELFNKMESNSAILLDNFHLGSMNDTDGKIVSATANFYCGIFRYTDTKIKVGQLSVIDPLYPLLSVKISVYNDNYAYVGYKPWTTHLDIDFSTLYNNVTAPQTGHIVIIARYRNEADTTTKTGVSASDFNGNIYIVRKVGDQLYSLEEAQERLKFGETKNIKTFMGMVQGGYTTDGSLSPTPSTTRVSCTSVIALPKDKAKICFKSSDGTVCLGFRHGSRAQNLSTNTYWFLDGDTYTFPATSKYFRFAFGRKGPNDFWNGNSTANISVDEVRTMIENGELSVYFEQADIHDDVIGCNMSDEKYVKASMDVFYGNVDKDDNPLAMPLFVHTSDLHGDYFRFNRFMDYADYLQVDAALITGDIVGNTGSNGTTYLDGAIASHTTKGFICLGNHDTIGTNNTNQAMYNNVMKANIDANSSVVDSAVTYPTYYYKDITAKKIRLIALNEYDEGQNNGTSSSYYTQQQINWFIATLASTPANYGVIVLMHSPEAEIPFDQDFEKFYQTTVDYGQYQDENITGLPLASIVDAFISGVALNKTFTETSSKTGQTATITISADFTSKKSGAEFLFFACGHEHADRIGYVNGFTNKILVIDITCGVAINNNHDYHWQAEVSDLPRGCVGSVQDAFNVYAVDRGNGTIRVARVGSNMPHSLLRRDFLICPYK